MTEDLMRYDLMAQRALRGIVRLALERAAAPAGLPGEHHFYISFSTRAPGVQLPEHLRAEYPEEMQVKFRHAYKDLVVSHDEFSVTMSFHQQAHRITVPFDAVTGFFDPTVNFALAWPAPETSALPEAQRRPEPHPLPELQPEQPEPAEEAQVVSLDAFRKK